MRGLSEAYSDGSDARVDRRRAAGAGLVLAGTAAFALGVAAAVGAALEVAGGWADPAVAGTLAGAGVPVAVLGRLAVRPAADRAVAAGAIGTGLAGLGVGLFAGGGAGADPLAAGVYALGAGVVLACAAGRRAREAGVAAVEGADAVVETVAGGGDAAHGAWSGRWEAAAERAEGSVPGATAPGHATPASDGGRAVTDAPGGPRDGRGPGAPDDGVVLTDDGASVPPDAYCGNCAAFRYARSEAGMRPYCGHHDALMDDMTACGDWRANQ